MPTPFDSFRKLTDVSESKLDPRVRSTGYRFAISDDVRFLNPQDWDVVSASGGFFMSRGYLSVLSDNAPEKLSVRCALIYDAHKPVAAVAAQLIHLSGERLVKAKSQNNSNQNEGENLLQKAFEPVARKAVSQIEEKLLVCGNFLSWGNHGTSFAPGISSADLWPAVSEVLYCIRRSEKLLGDASLLVIKDLTEAEMPGAESLRNYGYRPVQTDPDMVLKIEDTWKTYDDYLASLDGKYRKSVRNLIAETEAAGVTLETLNNLNAHQEVLHNLYLQVHETATIRPVTFRPSYLPELAKMAGDCFRCTVAKRGNEIVGFITCIKDGDSAIGYYLGYQREVAVSGVPLYLRLLHSTISTALDFGCKRLSLGRTALEPKARLGAKPEALYLWTRHRVRVVNWIFRSMVSALPHEEAPERNPFKKIA